MELIKTERRGAPYSLVLVRCLPTTFCRQLFADNFLPTTFCRKLFADNFLPTTFWRQLFADNFLPTAFVVTDGYRMRNNINIKNIEVHIWRKKLEQRNYAPLQDLEALNASTAKL